MPGDRPTANRKDRAENEDDDHEEKLQTVRHLHRRLPTEPAHPENRMWAHLPPSLPQEMAQSQQSLPDVPI